MAEITIFHNPRCSKARQTLKLLRDKGVEPIIVEYLDTPPSADEMKNILTLLGMAPRDLMRKKEAPYAAAGLGEENLSTEALIEAMRADLPLKDGLLFNIEPGPLEAALAKLIDSHQLQKQRESAKASEPMSN